MTYLSGFHSIEESLKAGERSCRLLVSGSGPRIKALIAMAGKLGIPVVKSDPKELETLAPGHRGIVLESKGGGTRPALSLDEAIATLPPESLILVLDHIEDPQNYGAILRSADAFGADLVIAAKRRAAPLSEAVVRASAGASAHVPVVTVVNIAQALRDLAAAAVWLVAADMEGTVLPAAQLPGRLAFVLGNEGAGVSRLLRDICDTAVAIPMSGHVDSLNVSVSAAILMYEYRRSYPAH